jgi:hypothetical protein|tara:strand:- start:247 stop:738 length:492 start_codon:yes stop_codon:yes gene_type:complete
MKYKIIDNALPQEEFENIKNNIICPGFPWNLSPNITNDKEVLPTYASFYFTHLFWDGFNIEPQSQMFAPLLNLMNCRALIRIKANCYPSTPEILRHDNHFDYPYPHKGAIFYLNTNDGLTILEDKVEVESIENRLLLFDSSKMHTSTTCTDTKCRINVNFNFF